jgi:hypothetical protein
VLIQNLHEADYLLDSQDQAGHPGLLVIKGIVSVWVDGKDIYKSLYIKVLALDILCILIKVYKNKQLYMLFSLSN